MKRILKINQRIDSSPLIYFKNSLFFILVLAIFLTWNKTGFHYKNRNIMGRCFCIYIFCLNIPIIYRQRRTIFFCVGRVWYKLLYKQYWNHSFLASNQLLLYLYCSCWNLCVCCEEISFLLIFVLQLFAFFQECWAQNHDKFNEEKVSCFAKCRFNSP